ncbi:hypothetical protein NPX13_g6225 [Xylaria arbuscula]|uniref:DUF7514 domain-containing protein n=1 Tax=Xylaria arbuscula TaxID=114810 RepID=A0A9W8TLM1_9PEZI|nr:hypothetical protein NPX13_g6225 [Xylaria arbuscula]
MASSPKSSPKIPSSTVPPSPADTPRPRPESQSQPPPHSQPRPHLYSHSRTQSQSQSQPHSEPQPQSKQQPEPENPRVDAKSYYGYLFKEDKSPTDKLDGLLRALGQYIIDHIGDTNDKQLSPQKLAAFYRTVGGDYDPLFLKTADRTISYIWQALGVQHTLQPIPDNDYAPPSVPSLTLRGFVRWQSLQILLGPEEHVPFLQYAVANWNLKDPYTGDAFPVDLPATAFPSTCDPAVDEWHRACGERLREAATPMEDDERPLPRRHSSETRIPTASRNSAYGVPAGGVPRYRPESEYFRRRRPMSYVHVPEHRYPPQTSYAGHTSVPEAGRRAGSSSGSSGEDLPRRGRRPSDVKVPPVFVRDDTRTSAHLDPHRPANIRRHSHSYQSPYVASVHDSDSESDTLRASPRHSNSIHQPPPSIRRMPAPAPLPATNSSRVRRSATRAAEDARKISLPAEFKKFTSFLMSSNRQRSSSREPTPTPHSSVRYRKDPPPRTRLSRSLSGESFTSDGSLPEMAPKYAPRDGREHNRAREHIIEREREERERSIERERERGRREWEEMERKGRREKTYLRPTINRRTSSHADIERRRHDVLWDERDRRDSRDLEREVRRNLTSDEMDRRDRRRYQDRDAPIVTGVGGRRYPR